MRAGYLDGPDVDSGAKLNTLVPSIFPKVQREIEGLNRGSKGNHEGIADRLYFVIS